MKVLIFILFSVSLLILFTLEVKGIQNIPIDLAKWALCKKKHKDLCTLYYLQQRFSGVFHERQLEDAFKASRIKVFSTFAKRLDALVDLGWIRKNEKTGFYCIHSLRSICDIYGLDSEKRLIVPKHVTKESFQAMLYCGYFAKLLRAALFYYKRYQPIADAINTGNINMGFVRKDKDDNKHVRTMGHSMETLAEHLGFSRQRANELKLIGKKMKFITTYKRKEFLRVVHPFECRYKDLLGFPGFALFKKNKNGIIQAFRILPDEVISSIGTKICKRRDINKQLC